MMFLKIAPKGHQIFGLLLNEFFYVKNLSQSVHTGCMHNFKNCANPGLFLFIFVLFTLHFKFN